MRYRIEIPPKKSDFFYNNLLTLIYKKMNNTDKFFNNLYNHLNNDQSYLTYNTSIQSQSSYSSSQINQYVYDKLLHDFQNYS